MALFRELPQHPSCMSDNQSRVSMTHEQVKQAPKTTKTNNKALPVLFPKVESKHPAEQL